MDTRSEQTAGSIKTQSSTIQCLGKPENTLFIVQVFAILISVTAAIINISLRTGNLELWTMILTASLGYLMPNPQFKNIKHVEETGNQPKNAD